MPTAASDMSFSVQLPGQGLEWSGSNLDTVFAQRRNLLRPRFLGMLRDLLRFNRLATRIALGGQDDALSQPLGDFLREHAFGEAFRDWYLLPMLGCIWSCPTDQMLKFPVATMVRFCHNHGLIQVANRPQWHTVRGGSREYVKRLLPRLTDARLNTPVRAVQRVAAGSGQRGVWLTLPQGREHFDEVVLAGHTDQSLALLGDHASADERSVLGAIGYHRNRALLHTDAGVLPQRRKAWAAWNYERASALAQEQSAVCLHYLINRLQPLPWQQPVVVSMNPVRPPRDEQVLAEFSYDHPVFDLKAIAAQARVPALQGRDHVWFAGAWTRYGFHEDGLRSGIAVAQGLKAQWSAQRPGRCRPCQRCRRQPAVAGRSVTQGTGTRTPGLAGTLGHAGPQLGLGQVRHRRLRPTEHAFAYPTWFLMLPMRRLRGTPCAALHRNRWGWLSFHDADHGQGGLDSLAWLDELLARHGLQADGEVWLHTYPRVLGFVFKPVSFWYCERADGTLLAVVAEVNNTFGGRHCYVLQGPDLGWGRELQADKAFHVSPFCQIEGRYRFRFHCAGPVVGHPAATDEAGTGARTVARVDHDDAQGLLLATSVSGQLAPLTAARVRQALWRMPLLTLGVVARIHWQALQLLAKRVPFFGKSGGPGATPPGADSSTPASAPPVHPAIHPR